MSIFKRLFLHSFKHYMIALSSFTVIVIIFMWIDKFYLNKLPIAVTESGLIVTFVGLLLLLSHFGAYDTLGYAFTTFKSRSRRPYKDLVEYTEVKKSKRKVQNYFFVPYIVVGLICAIIGFICWIIDIPLPKLDAPSDIKVEHVSEEKYTISFDKIDKATNGYYFYIVEETDSSNEDLPEKIYSSSYVIPQADSERITFEFEIPDDTKKYKIQIMALGVRTHDGSDKISIYVPE